MSRTSVQLSQESEFKLHDGTTFTASVGDWITIEGKDVIASRPPGRPADECTVWGGRAFHAKTGAVSTTPANFLLGSSQATNPHEVAATEKANRLIQLKRATPDNEMGLIPVKFGQGEGSTSWINVTEAEMEQIKKILTH